MIGMHMYTIGRKAKLYAAYAHVDNYLDVRKEVHLGRNKFERSTYITHGTRFINKLRNMKYKSKAELTEILTTNGVKCSLKKKTKHELIQMAMKLD
jgi:hypothetical protein